MFDSNKSIKLIDKIDDSSVDNEIKIFLKMASYRHVVFNYEKIADYYSNADKETQSLMEESALVIIDFKKALEEGYIRLDEQTAEQYLKEYGNE